MEMGQYTKMMGRLFNGKHNLRVRGRKIILELEPGLDGRAGQYSTEAQSRGTNLLWPLPVSRAQSRRAVLQPDQAVSAYRHPARCSTTRDRAAPGVRSGAVA